MLGWGISVEDGLLLREIVRHQDNYTRELTDT
jgi:hypothetical protein